ncbi:GtrA family protein [Arthrobacter sp. MAHUQ-56]
MGFSGLVVNLVALSIMLLVPLDSLAVGGEVLGAVIATQVAIGWSFMLIERWVFSSGREGRARRFVPYWALSGAALLAQLPLAGELQGLFVGSYLLPHVIAMALLIVAQFLVCDRWLYRRRAHHGRRLASSGARDT